MPSDFGSGISTGKGCFAADGIIKGTAEGLDIAGGSNIQWCPNLFRR